MLSQEPDGRSLLKKLLKEYELMERRALHAEVIECELLIIQCGVSRFTLKLTISFTFEEHCIGPQMA